MRCVQFVELDLTPTNLIHSVSMYMQGRSEEGLNMKIHT